jgi:CBS domain-containing protein
MAIAMAQSGGMGVIHRNFTEAEQAQQVRRVKRFVSGTVYNPITLTPDQTLADAKALQERYRITGFPVVDDKGRVLGIVTNRDMRFATDEKTPVRAMMTSDDLAIMREPTNLEEAKSLMHARRIEKLLVVDDKDQLTGLLTIKDLEQAVLNPQACKDELGRLRVAAASTVAASDPGTASSSSGRQPLATLAPACLHDRPTRLRLHAVTEAVLAGAASLVRLKCSLHRRKTSCGPSTGTRARVQTPRWCRDHACAQTTRRPKGPG